MVLQLEIRRWETTLGGACRSPQRPKKGPLIVLTHQQTVLPGRSIFPTPVCRDLRHHVLLKSQRRTRLALQMIPTGGHPLAAVSRQINRRVSAWLVTRTGFYGSRVALMSAFDGKWSRALARRLRGISLNRVRMGGWIGVGGWVCLEHWLCLIHGGLAPVPLNDRGAARRLVDR